MKKKNEKLRYYVSTLDLKWMKNGIDRRSTNNDGRLSPIQIYFSNRIKKSKIKTSQWLNVEVI